MKIYSIIGGGAMLFSLLAYSASTPAAAQSASGSSDSDALIAGYQLIQFDLAECDALAQAQKSGTSNGSGVVSPDILKLSGKICSDASMYQSKVKAAAKQKNIDLPKGLPYYLTARYAALVRNSGPNLGVMYLNDQITSHEDALDVFQDVALNGKDADIKAMAAGVIPVVQDNLDQLKAALAKNQ